MKPSEKRSVITSVRWTEDEFCRLQEFLTQTGKARLSDLVREATLAQLESVLQPYDKNEESNNERKERTKEKKETTKNVCLADSEIGDEAEASTHHKKEKSLAERRQEFWNRLVPFIKKGIYTREMVTAFYLYWTESNENGKKMRFEMEKTYELPRRLATWKRREGNGYGLQVTGYRAPLLCGGRVSDGGQRSTRSDRPEERKVKGQRSDGRGGQRLTEGLVVEQLRAKQLREQQSAEYLRYQEETQRQAISYAEYKKLQSETSNQQSLQQ